MAEEFSRAGSFRSGDPPPPYHNSPMLLDSDSPTTSDEEQNDELCSVCEPAHVRRRLVVCVDGTWMVPDGAIGSFHGNASNMSRIWSMVREGLVRDPHGKRWVQKRAFVPGIGAVSDLIQRSYSGITGQGYEEKIKHVYKLCCTDMCSQDEIFLFGFSRGAFVVRAVAGLLHHIRRLDVTAPNFDARFDNAIRLYRAARDKSRLQENSVFHYLSETQRSPCIKFIGLIDTVKALDDDNLNDIGALTSVYHVRHALALLEKRTVMSPERFDIGDSEVVMPNGHSIQEAWFMGSHGNLGGSCEQDGLSLWPLQWLVSEAKQFNLVFGFKRVDSSNVTDPAALIFQRDGDKQRIFTTTSGIRITMADLSTVLSRDGFFPRIKLGKGKFPSLKEFRPLFASGRLIGQCREGGQSSSFVHPSVFFLDDTDVGTIYALMMHPDCKSIRAERSFSISSEDSVFWVGNEELQLKTENKCPRILVCGQLSAGKSSLINKILGHNATQVSHGPEPGEHDINTPLSNHRGSVIFHDSLGFEAGKESNYEEVQNFLKTHRAQPIFSNQLHCIWFCVSTDLQRVQRADREFAKLAFGGIPIVLVFTKTDRIEYGLEEQAFHLYNQRNGTRFTRHELSSMPNEAREVVRQEIRRLLDSEKLRRTRNWNQRLPIFKDTIFISNQAFVDSDSSSVNDLMQLSLSLMTTESIAQIHAEAQESFISTKWDEALSKIIQICRDAEISDVLRADEPLKIRNVTRHAIERLSGVFELEGFQHHTFVPMILEILHPERDKTALPTTKLKSYMFLVALVGLPVLPIAIYALSNQRSRLLISCLEVALILERIFWYGTSKIDEKMVRAATFRYLKMRVDMVTMAKNCVEKKDIKSPRMKPSLQTVVDKFRYRRRSNLPIGATSD